MCDVSWVKLKNPSMSTWLISPISYERGREVYMYVFLFAGCPGEFGNGESEKSLSHPAISAHQWVDNPVVSWSLFFRLFAAVEEERISADFYHCFSSPPKERETGKHYIGRRIWDNGGKRCYSAASERSFPFREENKRIDAASLSNTTEGVAVVTSDGDWRILNNVQIWDIKRMPGFVNPAYLLPVAMYCSKSAQ